MRSSCTGTAYDSKASGRFADPRSDDARAMRRTAREVLNELRWRDPNRLPDAVIVYRDRVRLEGFRTIRGSEIGRCEGDASDRARSPERAPMAGPEPPSGCGHRVPGPRTTRRLPDDSRIRDRTMRGRCVGPRAKS